MSLILDALNRSEAERRGAGEVPGLATEHFSGSGPETRGWRQYLPWAGLVAALLIIAWLLLKAESEAVKPTVPAAAVIAASDGPPSPSGKGAMPATAAAVVTPQSVANEGSAPAAPIQGTQSTAQRVPATAPEVGRDLAQYQPDPEANPDPSIEALYQRVPEQGSSKAPITVETLAEPAEPQSAPVDAPIVASAESSSEREQALDIEQVLASAQRELENARLAEHPAPFIEDLSQQRKDAIPTLMYSIHNYSGRAGESSVVLNGKSLKEGASVGKGVKLAEILPDSIVLEHQGEQFRLRALNSWVNL